MQGSAKGVDKSAEGARRSSGGARRSVRDARRSGVGAGECVWKEVWRRCRGVRVEGSVKEVQGSACGTKCGGGAGECVWNEVWRMSR